MLRHESVRQRIRFTRAELDLIMTMIAIASASAWGEGDYQDWTEETSEVYNSLREKVATLLDRQAK